MAGDEADRVEVDHLIRELSAPAPKPTTRFATLLTASPTAPAAASPAAAPAPAKVQPVARQVTPLPRLPLAVRQQLASRVEAETTRRPETAPALRTHNLLGQLRTWIPAIRLPQFQRPALRLPFPRLASVPMPQFRLPALPDLAMPSEATTVRLWVGLGVALAMAMPFWPYPKTNALWMTFYMFAVVMVVIAGIWSARLTWAQRLGGAHIIAIAIVLWGITLYAEETLPLIGYAVSDLSSTPPVSPSA